MSQPEKKPFCVGDVVITADDDIGRITKVYAASPGWNNEDDRCELESKGEFEAGAVVDLGQLIGKFAYDEGYLSHYDGPVPLNSEGFTAQLVLMRDMRKAQAGLPN